jgi:hypothetical protein
MKVVSTDRGTWAPPPLVETALTVVLRRAHFTTISAISRADTDARRLFEGTEG